MNINYARPATSSLCNRLNRVIDDFVQWVNANDGNTQDKKAVSYCKWWAETHPLCTVADLKKLYLAK